ncbi:transcription termination factor NusA, partial [Chloroflexota bacterium]
GNGARKRRLGKVKSDFLLAITQLAAERNLPKEAVFAAVEAALVSAYKRDDFGSQHNIEVKIHPVNGDVKVYTLKAVVEKPEDVCQEISLADAQKIRKNAQLGETVALEVTSAYGGRIAAQTAKQVVLQRLREAERDFIFGEYSHREGEIVSGVVERADQRQTIIDLGKAEGMLPASEQVRTEHYRPGQRLKAYLLEVNRTTRGPRLIVSRSHPNLVKRLFELEVLEIRNGLVEIKAIAREPGYRSKVAVAASQEGIDAVGSCVGLRGVRIQNVVNELNGERIDVIQWNAQPSVFIGNAMSPAQVISVETREEEKTAIVVVPDSQLSLAIGKDGQNARLAARLTGWRIDIKSASAAEAAKAQMPEVAEEEAIEEVVAEVPAEEEVVAEAQAEAEVISEEPIATTEEPSEITEEVSELPAAEVEAQPPVPEVVVGMPPEIPELRFAEDIFAPRPPKPEGRRRDKKKQKYTKGEGAEPARPKKKRKVQLPSEDEEFSEYLEE